MNTKPNIFTSLTDLLAILLPGAILTLLLHGWTGINLAQFLLSGLESAGFISALFFLLIAFLLGYFIMWISSILDLWIYYPLRDIVYKDQRHLDKIREIRTNRASSYSNGLFSDFEWAQTRLMEKLPQGFFQVERYLAESRLFRALMIALFLAGIRAFAENVWLWGLGITVLWLFSLIRYFQTCHGATKMAYQCLIYLEETCEPSEPDDDPPQNEGPDTRNTLSMDKAFTQKVSEEMLAYLGKEQTGKIRGMTLDSGGKQIIASISKSETIFCYRGKGKLSIQIPDSDQSEQIRISSYALTHVPVQREIIIENQSSTSLELISIQSA
ncbi:MAG: hypothetical protein KDD99_07115 [Bacteroidetes bacterium]|nr:hypothetical protein [Bacteroidota bacterium]